MSNEIDKVAEMAAHIRTRIDGKKDDDTSVTRAIAIVIEAVVGDPRLAPSVIRKVACASAESDEHLEELCLLLARVRLADDRGEVRNAAGYFGSSAKRMVKAWGVQWEEPGRDLRIHKAG